MADKTDFLELTLPDNGEFVDNWDSPINANFETLDDHLKDLRDDLVGSSGVTTTLKGSKNDLEERLDVGLNSDGTLKLDTTADYTTLENSQIYGVSLASDQIQRIRDRFNEPEREIVGLRLGEQEDRYGVSGSLGIGPSMVKGVGRIAAMYRNNAIDAIQSPIRGFAPNSVNDGPANATPPVTPTHFISSASDEVTIQAGTTGVFYNIDGMLFQIFGDITLDLSTSGHNPPDDTYYAYVERNSGEYNGATNQWYYREYHGVTLSGGPYRLDPRILPTHSSLRADAASWTGPGNAYSLDPTDGSVTAGSSTLNSATAEFNTYGARRGDVLVVTSPASLAGEYVVGVLGGNTQIHMEGQFTATSAAVTFHLERRTFPSFGFTNTQTPTNGRVYIGEFVRSGGSVTSATAYAYNGIYDTGWVAFNSWGFPSAKSHYLGTIPSQIDVWIKDASGNHWKEPTVQVDVQHVDEKGLTTWGIQTLTLPAFKVRATATQIFVIPTNPLSDTTKIIYDEVAAAYVNQASATYNVRVIARR
jgi:hypothetical protein